MRHSEALQLFKKLVDQFEIVKSSCYCLSHLGLEISVHGQFQTGGSQFFHECVLEERMHTTTNIKVRTKVFRHRTAAAPDSKQHKRFRDKRIKKESRRRKSNNFSSLLNTQQQLSSVYFEVTENAFSVLY